MRHWAPAQFFFLSELQIQISAGQFWQRNRGNVGICRQPLVGSARQGCRTKGLDPARRAMSYLPLTKFFWPLYDHSPPAGRRSDLLASSRPFSPVLPPRIEMPLVEDNIAAHGARENTNGLRGDILGGEEVKLMAGVEMARNSNRNNNINRCSSRVG